MSKRAGNKRFIGVCQGPLNHCCGLCSFKTNSLTGLKLHLEVKHKKKSTIANKRENKEKCTVCGKTFKGIKEIIKHVKRMHRQT